MSNPTGLYSRIKTWQATDVLLASDLNAEFDNILNNFNPEMLAGYSQNQAQMQIQTAPGAVGSESLATSIAGELERLRFQMAAITGNTYWYSSPAVTIAQLNSALGAASLANKISSGLTTGTTGSVQPIFLLPANTTNTVTLKATATPFAYTIAGGSYTISADTTASSLTLAPSSQNTALIADLTLPQAGTQSNQIFGENGSTITMSTVGTSITAQVGNICAFKLNSEYILAKVISATQLAQVQRGYFFNSSNALISRGTASNGDTLTLMKLTWVFATTTGTLVVVYTNPHVGGTAPSSPATGDYWFDTSANIWKTYNSTSFVAANATLIGQCIQDTANTVGARSFDFFANYSDLNTLELYADAINSGTVVRARYAGSTISVYGNALSFGADFATWDFAISMDTGAQAASTVYYFYIDTNGRTWISKVAPFDRRGDLKGYYHPGQPWRCVGYGYSNALTKLETVESFYRSDDTTYVANITAANNNVILPYNLFQREQTIALSGANGAFTQILPPPQQLKGKTITYVRTDSVVTNVITLQSWGTAIANPTGTISTSATPTKITGISSTAGLVPGQLVSGVGIAPNTTLIALEGGTAATISANATLSITGGTFNFANSAGYSGTVGQQTNYLNYGINGAFTTPLNTQYEAVTITSDGFAYFIQNRRYPQITQNFGTISLTNTSGTASTKGTTTTDRVLGIRVGNKLRLKYEFRQTTTGNSGNDTIIINMPTGYVIDTNQIRNDATANGTGSGAGDATAGPAFMCGAGWLADSSNSVRGILSIKVYNSTGFSGALTYNGASIQQWPIAVGNGGFNAACGWSFEVEVPILGWAG